MSTNSLRAAVVGVGHLGRWHAAKYAQIDGIELVAVVDRDLDRAVEIADEHGCNAVSDAHEILDQVDLVSLVTPTSTHHEITLQLLQHGIHVLVEKPITVRPAEARELIDTAAQHGLVLQVGHIERFNAAFRGMEKGLANPRFIECNRIAPFNTRTIDVSVVLDLMIHDIDLIMSLVGREISDIRASGAAVMTGHIDIANARLEFEGGCVANVTASRVSQHVERKLRIFQECEYTSIDFYKRVGERHVLQPNAEPPLGVGLCKEVIEHGSQDALLAEIEAFIAAVRGDAPVVVDGLAGLRALEVADAITKQVHRDLAVMRPCMTH